MNVPERVKIVYDGNYLEVLDADSGSSVERVTRVKLEFDESNQPHAEVRYNSPTAPRDTFDITYSGERLGLDIKKNI